MKNQKCRLCNKSAELKKSHLLAKSFYKIIARSFEPHDSASIWASRKDKSLHYTNSQIVKKLLCKECEDRFNKCGEEYVISLCLKNPQRFKIKRKLDTSTPSIHKQGVSYFSPSDIPELDSQKLLYFAASIVWRVVATNWSNEDISKMHGSLPQELEKSLQDFLLNKTDFPEDIYITVCVDSDHDPLPILSFPTGDFKNRKHMSFFIPGIKFNIFYGQEVDKSLSETMNDLNINTIYMYRSFRNSREYKQMTSLISKELIPKGKLVDELKKWR